MHNMGMMKKKMTVSLMVFIKHKYKYSRKEEDLIVLVDKLGGKFVGGGTDLCTRQRDQQYFFPSLKEVKTFLNYKTTKDAILKEISLVRIKDV